MKRLSDLTEQDHQEFRDFILSPELRDGCRISVEHRRAAAKANPLSPAEYLAWATQIAECFGPPKIRPILSESFPF